MNMNQRVLSKIYLVIIGLTFGVSSQLDAVLFSLEKLGPAQIICRILFAIVGVPALFCAARKIIINNLLSLSLPCHVTERYQLYDTFIYIIFLLPMLGRSYIHFSPLVVFSTLLLFVMAQMFLITFLTGKDKKELFASLWLIPSAFHISGFCALIYQIVWQRALFTEFGVNIESITIVVSVFMFGLGIGSLMGGFFSKRFPARLPQIFMVCEVMTGIFGVVSLQLIKMVSHISSHDSMLTTSVAIFGLLFIPTLFMGATLPVLVTHVHRNLQNVGASVGGLYFINTLGAAIACFVTADVFFSLFGKQASVLIAACGNLLVGSVIYVCTRTGKKGDQQLSMSDGENLSTSELNSSESNRKRFYLALFLSCLTGYISLSQEILWFRAMSYASGGKPAVFAHVLGTFLIGIALGALMGKKVCLRGQDIPLTFIATMLTISSAIYFFSMPIMGYLMKTGEAHGMLASYIFIGSISFLMGCIFPVLCHKGITSNDSVGRSLSWIYFANIVGSTAGPLITGFVLLNFFSLQTNMLFLSLFIFAVAAMVVIISPLSLTRKSAITAIMFSMALGILFSYKLAYSELLEKLQFKAEYVKNGQYKYLVQNRSGIIAVTPGNPDIIYGGGIYDGRFAIDPVRNTNGITRAYMVAALHAKPADILQIGLSSGSWAKVIANYRDLRKFTIVEINPGYLQLVSRYHEIASILNDPKINICVDDGRRWLNRNPDARFDFIVMNTTFYWRDGSTNLLSEEFLRLCKKHLKEGGVIYYNTTGSEDVIFTAASVFKHVTRYMNFVAASDRPFAMSRTEIRRNLLKFEEDGKPILARDPSSLLVLDKLAKCDISDNGDKFRQKKNLWVITDDNMATEFKKNVRWTYVFDTWPAKLFAGDLSLLK